MKPFLPCSKANESKHNDSVNHTCETSIKNSKGITEKNNTEDGLLLEGGQFSCGGSQGFANLLHPNLPEGHIHIFILSNNIVSIGSGGEKGGRSSPGTCLPPSPMKAILPQIQISIPLTTRANSGSIPSTP